MSDEAKLHKDVARGVRAAAALEEFGTALDALERDYTEAWKVTGLRDADGRERLWQAIQIVGKVRTHVRKLVDNGKLAEREIEDIKKLGGKKFLGLV